MALVCPAKQVEFSFIREQLGVTDSDLSKQLRALGELDYLTVERVGDRRGGTTWVSATATGRERYTSHCDALREILGEI
jgi:DNA-binding MarR family transcriptional regulator